MAPSLRAAAARYIMVMKQSAPKLPSYCREDRAWRSLAFAAATGVAFAAWVDNGAGMLMAMVETGLAWCF